MKVVEANFNAKKVIYERGVKMRERILSHLKQNGTITTWEAIDLYGCTRLSEYIRQIRLEHDVTDRWITKRNRYGESVNYKEYLLID